MVTAGTEPGVVPLTEVVVLFNKVQEKPILILLALFYEGHLQCVCISYVNFMLGKKKGGAVVPCCHFTLLSVFCLHLAMSISCYWQMNMLLGHEKIIKGS